MMNVKGVTTAIVVGLALLGCTAAWSLGLGSPTSHAILGETLSVVVPLRLEAGEEITPECVAADVFFGDDKLSGSAVSAVLLPGDGTQRTVRVTTTSLINEPVVTVYLAAGCKARITRKLVAFADPPSLPTLAERTAGAAVAARSQGRGQDGPRAANASESTTASAANATDGSAATAVADAGQAPAARPAKPRPTRSAAADPGRPARRSAASTAAAPAAPVREAQPVSPAAAPVAKATTREPAAARLSAKVDPRPAQGGQPRLELDPADLDAVVAPALLMSSGLTGVSDLDSPQARERRAAAAALWAAMNASPEQLARDRQRMQELEQRLARLQQDSAGAQSRVAAMEARLKEAEDPLAARWLTYALLAACALLAAALAWLWRRQKAEAQPSTWWESGQQTEAPASEAAPDVEPALARTSAEFMPVRREADGPAAAAAAAPSPVPAPAVASGRAAAPPVATPPTAPVSVQTPGATEPAATLDSRAVLIKPEVHDAVRAITVEELIDLEQQAEFFVVLGQDDAAIELLESHVQTTAGASPLPYLKLLEIHQRLGRRQDYERLRLAFNGRFNAYAPDWDADLQHGHSLEDYPGVVERLQSLWSTPARAMEVLQVSLTRADGSEETFDLPAYRELLFLYAVARDLSERESQDRAPVDLLLPVHDRQSPDDGPVEEVPQPLMATRPVKALPEASPSLSLDLSLDDPAPAGAQLAGTALENSALQPAPQDDGHLIDFEPIDVPQRPKG